MSRLKTITERNIDIQERAAAGESLDSIADFYGLTRMTVYTISLRRKPKRVQRADETDPFLRLDR